MITVDEFPKGYPKLAAIVASDNNFLMLKKYSWLRTRILLNIQDELLELQDNLSSYDSFDEQNERTRLISRRKDEGYDTTRKDLLRQIAPKLQEYGKHSESLAHLSVYASESDFTFEQTSSSFEPTNSAPSKHPQSATKTASTMPSSKTRQTPKLPGFAIVMISSPWHRIQHAAD